MADNKLHLRLLTPDKKIIDDYVDMVVLRSSEGDIGVLHGHEALTTVLGYGLMRVFNGDEEAVYSVLGGFAEIGGQEVTVLSDAAEHPEEIDKERVLAAKARAERILKDRTDSVDIKRAELALRRAHVRIEASSYPLIGGGKKL